MSNVTLSFDLCEFACAIVDKMKDAPTLIVQLSTGNKKSQNYFRQKYCRYNELQSL